MLALPRRPATGCLLAAILFAGVGVYPWAYGHFVAWKSNGWVDPFGEVRPWALVVAGVLLVAAILLAVRSRRKGAGASSG